MGLVIMSDRELNRIEVLSQVILGAMTAVTAASVLELSRRQVHRLLKDFRTEGPGAIRHKARGRRSSNWIDPAVRAFAVTLLREKYNDFGPTFAAEKLAEDHYLKVSRETLRKCPLMHPADALPGNRCRTPGSGCPLPGSRLFANDEYPYWSSWIFAPFPLISKQCICRDNQLSHHCCDRQLLAFSGLHRAKWLRPCVLFYLGTILFFALGE